MRRQVCSYLLSCLFPSLWPEPLQTFPFGLVFPDMKETTTRNYHHPPPSQPYPLPHAHLRLWLCRRWAAAPETTDVFPATVNWKAAIFQLSSDMLSTTILEIFEPKIQSFQLDLMNFQYNLENFPLNQLSSSQKIKVSTDMRIFQPKFGELSTEFRIISSQNWKNLPKNV